MKLKSILHRSDDHVQRRRPVPWIADPTESSESEDLLRRGIEEGSVPDGSSHERLTIVEEKIHRDFPGFKKRHAASPIELFYDLFFVANLSSFTSTHDINTFPNLKSYIGFISLMWFVWLQTTLFDIRFNTDSVLSRFFKAFHLGIMIAFAVLAPTFDSQHPMEHPKQFRDMSLILMGTRLVLAVQYATVAWFVRGYKHTLVANSIVIAILFSDAMMFLGISFAFTEHSGAHGYVGWYVISGFEAVAMIAISSFWKVLSFKNTAIVDRFAGMTLIVLGEGVVGMTKAATKITQGALNITKSSIGLMIAYVLIIYFIYMIYFDQLEEDRFGTIRQQFWALLHYPLHIAVLLTIEGSRSAILYDAGRRLTEKATNSAMATLNAADNISGEVDALKHMVDYVSQRVVTKGAMPDFQHDYDVMLAYNASDPNASDTLFNATTDWSYKMTIWVMGTFGFEVPESPGETTTDMTIKLAAKMYVQFTFFFVAAGVTLVALAVLHWFGKTHKTQGEVASIFLTTIIGIGLALVSVMVIDLYDFVGSPFDRFSNSSWIEPTVLLTYALVLGINCFIIWFSYRRHYKRVTAGV